MRYPLTWYTDFFVYDSGRIPQASLFYLRVVAGIGNSVCEFFSLLIILHKFTVQLRSRGCVIVWCDIPYIRACLDGYVCLGAELIGV